MNALKQGMTLADVVAIGLSAAIGVSIFSVVAPAATVAGPALLIALALAAIPMTIFAIVYAFLNAAAPRTGSSYAWPAHFVHPLAGFLVCWLRIAGNAGSLYVMASVFVSYLSRMIDLPALPVMIGILTLAYLNNLLGAAAVGRVARYLIWVKLIVLVGFIVMGLPHIRLDSFVPFAPSGALGILAALPLLVGLYTGIESAAEAGQEIKDTKRTMKIGMAIATGIGLSIYLGTSVVTLGVLGAPGTSVSGAPLADAASIFFGAWTAPVIVITALLSIAAAMNATILIFARFMFAMGEDRVLPARLGAISERLGTPHVAITVAYALGLLSLFLPKDLLFLFLAANLPTMLKYGLNCFASVRLIRFWPELQRASSFGYGPSAMRRLSWAGVGCAIIMLAAGATADWRPYALLAVWGALGLIYWQVRARHDSLYMQARQQAKRTS